MKLHDTLKGACQTPMNNVDVLDHLGATTSQVCFAVGALSVQDNPEFLSMRYARAKGTSMINPDSFDPWTGKDIWGESIYEKPKPLSKKEFDEKYSDSSLEYDPNMTEDMADSILEQRQKREHYEHIISKGKGGFKEEIAKFAT